ncbi:MAG: hypothetical protein OXH08_07980 [Gammaproteobacteria bacterium]|nr:hypothetical protein [Gammaproteobacteria bacterium]MDE0648921.1 hypothetical protein [Gammaproteobacteria bacterium]
MARTRIERSRYWEMADLDTEFLYQISRRSGSGAAGRNPPRVAARAHIFEAWRIGPQVVVELTRGAT